MRYRAIHVKDEHEQERVSFLDGRGGKLDLTAEVSPLGEPVLAIGGGLVNAHCARLEARRVEALVAYLKFWLRNGSLPDDPGDDDAQG